MTTINNYPKYLTCLLALGRRALWLNFFLALAFCFTPLYAGDDDVAEFVPDQIVVKLNPGNTIEAINVTYGTTTLDMLLGSASIYLLQIGSGQEVEEVVNLMAHDPRLLYAEMNYLADMPEGDPSGTWAWGGYDPDPYREQYAAALLNLSSAHTLTQGAGVIVAVLDTGIQLDHPRLAAQITSVGYDFIDDDSIAADEANGLDDDGDGLIDEGFGHGTHVAGIVNLMAPAAQIMPLRVLDSDGRGNDFKIAEAVQFARAHGATVVNLSLGTPIQSRLVQEILNDAAASGVVLVAAAGNLNRNIPHYPAAYPNVLAVTAVGADSRKSPFASYGPWVDIAAPGQSITSTFPTDGYAQWSGTSMAAGFISGQAALLRAHSPALNVTDITWLIQTTAQPIDSLNPGYARQMGAGLADAAASLNLISGTDCGPAFTLTANADAWMEQNSATNNKGSDSILKVKAQGGNDNFRAALRFTLPVVPPTGCVVESAILRLYAPSWTSGRTLQVLRLTSSWSEMGISWNNQPATTGAAATTPSGQGYREWNVTAQVQGMMDVSASYGFLIRDANEGGSGAEQQFHSRENSQHPPQLIVQFAPGTIGPIPSTTAITFGPAVSSPNTEAAFAFTSNEPQATFTCSLDGGPFVPCTSPHTVTNLPLGSHTFAVQAADGAGNLHSAPAQWHWTTISPLPPIIVSCGQLLFSSALILNDLYECPGDGLVIAAAGITLDLNGRTLDGMGLGVGIRNDGYAGVTIANGTVQQFDFGIQLNSGTAHNQLTGLILQHNQEVGLDLVEAHHTRITGNSINENSGGIRLNPGTTNTWIEGNALAANDSFALHLLYANYNQIGGNLITDSSNMGLILEDAHHNNLWRNAINDTADSSIILLAGSGNNRIEDNWLTGGSDAGIVVMDSSGNELLTNIVHNMGDAGIILINAHNNVVRGNDLRWNGTGIELDGAVNNFIQSNHASYSGSEGITLENDSLGNLISLNLVNFNAATGIMVDVERLPNNLLPGNLIAYNSVMGNLDDGLAVPKAGHTLVGNMAKENAGWGIYAGPGTLNGGGNVAVNNVESQQCFNFSCSSSTAPPDTTPPDTLLEVVPAAATTDSSATFQFSTNEVGSTFACALNGGAFAPCSSPMTLQGLTPGLYTFAVQAIDLVGNADPTPASFAWTVEALVDCGPPLTVYASADAWIEQNSPGNNKGSDSILKVKAQGSQDNFRTLVRFAIPTNIPASCVVESATLRLYASSYRPGRTLQAFRLTGSWSEMGVTWGNQPAVIGAAAITSSGSGYRSWDVTAQVQAMLGVGNNHGFLIRDASESGSSREQSFHSREHSHNSPQLLITFTPNSQ